MEDISISVKIANRPYKLIVNRNDEEAIRNASLLIEEKINEYKSYFYKDYQDLLAMAILQFATNSYNYGKQTGFINSELEDKLIKIDKLLDDNLLED